MDKESTKNKYIELLTQAEAAIGRKESVRLIHKADKERISLGKRKDTE